MQSSDPSLAPHSLNDSTWLSFFQACASVKALPATRSRMRKEVALKILGPACELCGVGLVIASAALCFLVPTLHGGTPSAYNDALLCSACASQVGKQDMLLVSDSVQVSPALLSRRLGALERSHNHLVPWSARGSRALVRAHLMKRWAYPRMSATVFDGRDQCLVGFSRRHHDDALIQAWGVSLQTMGGLVGTRLTTSWAGFAFDGSKTMEAIELLIERNVFCRRVLLDGWVQQNETSKLAREWWLTGTDIGQCR